jgi:hypothetical protein
MKTALLLSAVLLIPSFGQDLPQRHHRLWNWSVAVLAAANAADIGTSLGRHELNPVLAGRTGMLDTGRAIGLKAGLFGGLAVTEFLIHRHHPEVEKPFVLVNFATAATLAAIAAHNATVPKSVATQP